MRSTLTALVLTIALILSAASSGLAQPATQPTRIETRTFDVSDLLRATVDYPLNDGGGNPVSGGRGARGGRGGGQPSGPQESQSGTGVDIGSIAALLINTISPETWKTSGGQIGAVSALGTVLVVTQSRENLDRITALLAELRQDPSLSTILAVRAFWVTAEPQEIATLFANRRQAAGASEMVEVPEAMLDKQHLYCMGQTMCFNGQTVSIVTSRDKNYISDMTPVVAANAAAFDPTIGVAQNGVKLQVTPQLVPAASGPSIALDLRSTVLETSIVDALPVPVATTNPVFMPEGVKGIDRINVLTQEFRTTVRLPLRKKILIGGMTMEPSAKDAASRQLFLVVEVDSLKS